MAVFKFFLILLSVSTMSFSAEEISASCPNAGRLNLSGEIPDALGSVKKSGYVFPPKSRWFENGMMFGCICYDKPCLPLCCPFGKVLVKGNCIADDQVTFHTFPLIYTEDLSIEELEVEDHFQIVISEPCGSRGAYLLQPGDYPDDDYYLLKNGSMYLPDMSNGTMWGIHDYCFWRLANSTNYAPRVCFPDYTPDSIPIHHTISNVGMIISIPFLLVTFVVYWILPEMRNIHGVTLRGYVGCLFVAYTTLAVVQTVSWISDLPCIFVAFVIYFSFLASFFWLNVMCFDIWWTFGGLRPLQGNLIQRENKKVLMYSIYALGCACLATGICMIMDFIPGIPDNLIRPEFGVGGKCWFRTDRAAGLYFYGPMGVTLICNTFFFVSTAVKIIRHKKSTAHNLKRTNSKRHGNNDKQWLNLYLKLFIVMGINWSMEIISWLHKDLKYVWYITDMGNALQGLIIFIIFICKRNVLRLLLKRFGCRRAQNFLSQDSTRKSHNPSSVMNTGTMENSSVSIRREDHF